MASVGEVLSGPDGRRIRLAGVSNGEFVAESVDDFGPAFRISAAELTSVYGVNDPTPPPEDSYTETLQRADTEATAAAARAYGESQPETHRARRRAAKLAQLGRNEPFPPAGSPEAVFAAEAASDDDDTV